MTCYISAMVGTGLLVASYMSLSITDEYEDKMEKVLSKELAEKYENIIEERRNHYFIGLALGVVIAYFFVNSFKIKNTFFKTSSFFSVALIIAGAVYMLTPKSDYMLTHLTTKEQNKVWLEIFETMKSRFALGFILGAVAIIPIAKTLC
jgi:hypothetical protein